MTTARRPRLPRLFTRPDQRVDLTFHGPVHLEGGVIGIANQDIPPPKTLAEVEETLFGATRAPATDRPSTWLDPRAGVLPPVERAEFADLVDWCRDPAGPVARLVIGSGGQGKTHLAEQVCAALRRPGKRGRLAGFVTPSRPGVLTAVQALARFRHAGALLVVDYADGHPGFVAELLRAAGAGRVRVLLLSRTEPYWWRDIVDGGPAGLVDPRPTRLGPLSHSSLWTDAVRTFAGRLGVEPVVTDSPAGFETTLDLYASALLRVLDPAASDEDPLTGVLRHERAAVSAGARAAGLDRGSWRDLAVSAAFLRAAPGMTAAAAVLGTVPELRHLDEHGLRAAAEAIGAAYPGDGSSVWRAPVPDRLADTHLLATAQDCPADGDWDEHVRAVCRTSDPDVAGHVAQVLVRALSTPGADRHYAAGLRRVERSLGALAVDNPVYLPPLVLLDPLRYKDILLDGIAAAPIDIVRRLDSELPDTSVARRAIAVAVSRRLVADSPDHLTALSRRLAEAGEPGALAAAREAVAHAGADQRAAALTALSHRLAEHGDPQGALAAAEEAAELRPTGTPRGYALHNLAMRLTEAGRPDAAVGPAGEAVTLLTGDTERPRRAAALLGLANVLAAAGFPGRAVAPAEQAVALLRELADGRPDAYLPDLATALVGLSQHLSPPGTVKPPARAVDLAEEAVAIHQRLAATDPAAFGAALAESRMNLGVRLSVAGRKEAGDVLRAAVDEHTDKIVALTNLALHEGAPDLAARVVELERPRGSRADLAAALSNLGYLSAVAGRHGDALAATGEAVALYRGLLADEPSALHRVWLADALLNLARHHLSIEDDHAADLVTEAVGRYADVEGEHPDTARDRVRDAVALLGALNGDRPKIPKDATRYCRRWREAVVRIPMPGVALVVIWRTDRAPRRDQVRTVRDEILALTGKDAAVAVPAQPVLARVATAAVDKVKSTATRIARHPSVEPVAQFVQANPGAVAKLGAVVATVAVLLSAAGPEAATERPTALPPPVTSTAPTDLTDPLVAPTPAAPTSPTTSRTSPQTTTSRTTGTVSQPEPPVVPPVTTSRVVVEPPRDGLITFDATATSYREFRVIGAASAWRDGHQAQGLDLGPGTHQIAFAAGPTLVFTVDDQDRVDYDHGLDAYVTGRGTPTITVRGKPASVDISGTSYAGYYLSGTGEPWQSAPRTYRVIPGRHQVVTQAGPATVFDITPEGTVEHSAAMAPYLSGRGTTTLTVRGRPVSVDADATSYSGFLLTGTGQPWQNARARQTYQLIPGRHQVVTQDGAGVLFTVGATGLVEFPTNLDPVLVGRDTTTLVVRGVPTTLDATATSYDQFYIPGAGTWRQAARQQEFRLIPGTHQVALHAGPALNFTTDSLGRVSYASTLDPLLDGRGTAMLTVRGTRAKFGYARSDTAGNQWGTWQQNPATKDRSAETQHTATGRYLVRFPALASTKGVAHVTVFGNNWGVSCVVRDSRDDGQDHLVDIACHLPTGALTDTQFTVLFAEPKARLALVDTASGLRSGAPISVRRLGVGDYEVTVDGFPATGYAQVTPRGSDPVRCRTTVGATLRVQCVKVGGDVPADTAWALSYADNTTLAPFAPGAYVGTTKQGLELDPARSYNSAGGAMKAQWLTPGHYRVGIKGVGLPGDTVQATITGDQPGYCHSTGWNSLGVPKGEVWVDVYCYTPAGRPADREFGVATLRPPTGTAIPTDNLTALDPGPHPAGPKWGYFRVIAPRTGPGVRRTLHPDFLWSTWTRRFDYPHARWAPDATVEHSETGRYRVRLPGLGATDVVHATARGTSTDSCNVVAAVDGVVDVWCFNRVGALTEGSFALFVAEPSTGSGPLAVIAPGVRFTSTGAQVDVSRTGPGEYTATIDGFASGGHVQLTTAGTAPVRCHPVEVTGALTIRVRCHAIATGIPTDADWHLTYVQGVGLHHDPTAAGTTVDTDGTAITRYYDSEGTPPVMTRVSPGHYWVSVPTADRAPIYPADGVQVTTLGPTTNHCAPRDWNPSIAVAVIDCWDAAGRRADTPFSLAYLRVP
ncbi:hypothetical protein [Actinokineospora sp. HUAS TT18]|uniref:hypothetical protein n=1 Tax=Actinokineospora sp. HUAS TT18 TaxID=3447451 RepID=UPI003F51B7EF